MRPVKSSQPKAALRTRRRTVISRPRRVTQRQIAVRAYEIFLGRDGGPGDQLSDWLQAEAELRAARRN
jgi:hypothetical protein